MLPHCRESAGGALRGQASLFLLSVAYDGRFYGVGLETSAVGGNTVSIISTTAEAGLDTQVQTSSHDTVIVGSQAPNF